MGHHRHRQARQAEDSGQYSEFRFHGRTSRRFTERPQFLSFLWSGFCLLPTLIGRREACSAAVLIVLKADELEHLEARAEKLERNRVLELPGNCCGGVEGEVEEKRCEIGPRVSFDRVHLLRMRGALAVEPELVVVSNRIDDESVAVPPPDGV